MKWTVPLNGGLVAPLIYVSEESASSACGQGTQVVSWKYLLLREELRPRLTEFSQLKHSASVVHLTFDSTLLNL